MLKNLLLEILIVVAVSFSVVSGSAAASAGSEPSLSAWLVQCQTDRQECLDYLKVYFAYADDSGACPPENLTADDAEAEELGWLQNAAAKDPALAAGTRYAAQLKAMLTLWPCK